MTTAKKFMMVALLTAPIALAGCGSTKTVTQTATVTHTQTNTVTVAQAVAYANCGDNGTCPLTLARARSAIAHEAAAAGAGDRTGVTSCTQQSPWEVTCGYWDNYASDCHYVGTFDVFQPTYQRALQYKDTPAGSCQ